MNIITTILGIIAAIALPLIKAIGPGATWVDYAIGVAILFYGYVMNNQPMFGAKTVDVLTTLLGILIGALYAAQQLMSAGPVDMRSLAFCLIPATIGWLQNKDATTSKIAAYLEKFGSSGLPR